VKGLPEADKDDALLRVLRGDGALPSGIHVGLRIMDLVGVVTVKGAPDLGGCGLSRSA
jgi:hypothetical protein